MTFVVELLLLTVLGNNLSKKAMVNIDLPEHLLEGYKKLTYDEFNRCMKWHEASKQDAQHKRHSLAFEAYLQLKQVEFFVHFCGDTKTAHSELVETRIEMAIYLKKPTIVFATPAVQKTGIIERWQRQGLSVHRVFDNTGMTPQQSKRVILEHFAKTRATAVVERI